MGKKKILFELFGGICGFSKGLEDAGINFEKIYYSDIDKSCEAVAKYNYGKKIETIGAIENVSGLQIERPNIITFGSPCQGFSQGGNNGGIADERSGLILKAIEVVTYYRPDLFIWENVKGVITKKHREDFWSVIRAFTNIGGYRFEWQLVDTRWLLPQHRERIFLIGHLAGKSEPGVFPICQNRKRITEGKTTAASVATITGGGHHSGMTLIYNRPHGYFKGSVTGFCPTLKLKSTEHNMFVYQDNLLRRLTEIECERLHGFPDDWTKFGEFNGVVKPISKTARYRILGNAVSTVITKEIGINLKSVGLF